MKKVDYEDLSLRLHNKADSEEKRVPLNAALELTYRCNNKCLHCFCNLPEGDRTGQAEELTRGEIERLFDELQGMGCLWLLITGGEPLLRADFPEIYLSAKNHGFLVTVFTNGTLISDEIADLFAEFPPFSVEITMYGATKKTYERITLMKGSYDRYWSGLERLLKRQVKVKLKTMALTVNRHELRKMSEIARDLGCRFRFDPLVQRRIDSNPCANPERYRLSPEDVASLDMEFPERMEAHKELCLKMVGEPERSETLLPCGAGRSMLHIMPSGLVLPCSMLFSKGISSRKKSLKEIWESDFRHILEEKKNFTLKCDSCVLQELCGQCAGWSFVEYRKIGREVRYLCDIAHRRAEKFPFMKRRKSGNRQKK